MTEPREPPAEEPEQPSRTTSRLLSATAIMASGTAVSRVFGVVRVLLVAAIFSQNSQRADIFTIATTIPNALYLLFAGGAVNQVLVPQIVRAVKNDPDGGEAYTNRIMTAFLLIIAALTIVFVVASPLVTGLYTDSGWRVPELTAQYRSIVILTTICLPQIFFYGAFFLGGQVLNARGAFGPMMWAPVVNNVVQIGVLGLYAGIWGFSKNPTQPFTDSQMWVLGLGSVVGLAIQTVFLVPFMRRVGFRYRPRFDLRHTGLGHTFSVAKWALLFVGAAQVWYLILTRWASKATTADGSGAGTTVYSNAYLVYVLPHSFITISLGTALMSSLSAKAARQDLDGFASELTQGTRLMSTAVLPIALLYIAIGVPLAQLPPSWRAGGVLTGWTLMALSLGLFQFSLLYLVQRAYFALEDNRAVFFQQVVITVAAIIIGYVLISVVQVPPNWVAPALALANSLSYTVGLIYTLLRVRGRIEAFKVAPILAHAGRVGLAAIPGAALAGAIAWYQSAHWDGLAADTAGLVAAIGVAGGVYLGMSRLLRLTEVAQVIGLVTRRLKAAKE